MKSRNTNRLVEQPEQKSKLNCKNGMKPCPVERKTEHCNPSSVVLQVNYCKKERPPSGYSRAYLPFSQEAENKLT